MRTILPFLPSIPDKGREVANFMFYDLERRPSPIWVEFFERLFARYADTPRELICASGDEHYFGEYLGLRPRLEDVLVLAAQGAAIDFRIRSAPRHPQDGLLPSDISIAGNTMGPSNATGSISVAVELAPDLDCFARDVARQVAKLGGAFYGHASRFPAEFGPDAYLSSVGAIPKGWSFADATRFTQRLTNWRRNVNERSIHPSRGFFREVFPLNFLTHAHLAIEIEGGDAISFYDRHGILEPLDDESGMFVWSVPFSQLSEASKALELQGILLSDRPLSVA